MHGCIGLNPTRSRISCAGKKIRAKLHTIIKAINYPSPVIINTKRIPRKRWSKQPKWKQLFLLPIFPSFPRNDVSNFFRPKKKKKKKEKRPTLPSPYHPLQFEAGPLSAYKHPPSINPVSLESRYLGQSFSWKKRVDPGKSLITVAWIKGRGGGGIGVH